MTDLGDWGTLSLTDRIRLYADGDKKHDIPARCFDFSKHDTDSKTKWKLKYYWGCPEGSGWAEIDAHEECIKAVAREARLRGVKMKGGEK